MSSADENNTSDNGTTTTGCSSIIQSSGLAYIILPTAICIVILLSLIEKKVVQHGKRNCCGRGPSPVIPVNLLDGDENRLTTAAAFGCASTTIIRMILDPSFNGYNVPAYLVYLYILLISLFIGLVYYPLFLCLQGSCPLIHSVIGLLYAALWLCVHIVDLMSCPGANLFETTWINVIISVPALLCLLFIIIRFINMIFLDTKHLRGICKKEGGLISDGYNRLNKQESRVGLARPHHLQYVRCLLDTRYTPNETGQDNTDILNRIKLSYQRSSTFRYPPTLTTTFFVAGICLYQIFGLFVYISVEIIVQLKYVLDQQIFTGTVHEQLHIFYDTATICHFLSFGVATVIILFFVWRTFVSYRQNIIQLYRGNFSNIPKAVLKQTPAETVAYSVHYCGSQIAYLLWSYLLQYTVLLVASLLVSYLIVLPILGLVPDVFLTSLYTIISAFVTSQVFYYSQLLVSKKLLLQKEEVYNPVTKKTNQILALRNRKLYHNLSYLLFFFYIFLGLFKCFVRILKATVLGVIFFGRLDKSALIEGYETWDAGYMAYVSFIKLELVHCHPVLVVFCDLLLERQEKRNDLKNYGSTVPLRNRLNSLEEEQMPNASRNQTSLSFESPRLYDRAIQSKWLKLYTIIRNPMLQKNNKQNM